MQQDWGRSLENRTEILPINRGEEGKALPVRTANLKVISIIRLKNRLNPPL